MRMRRAAHAMGAHHPAQSPKKGDCAKTSRCAILCERCMVTSPTRARQRMPANRKANLRGTSGEPVHPCQPDGYRALTVFTPNWLIGCGEARVLSLVQLA